MPLSDETKLAFETPAKFANRFSVAAMPYGIRVAFAELSPDENQDKARAYHTAIVMMPTDAKALRDSLEKMIRTLEDHHESKQKTTPLVSR